MRRLKTSNTFGPKLCIMHPHPLSYFKNLCVRYDNENILNGELKEQKRTYK